MTDHVLSEVQNGIGVLTLNRGAALNALTLPMIEAISDNLTVWEKDEAIKAVVVMSNNEKAFCAGGDVKAVALESLALREGRSDGKLCQDLFRAEYELNTQIKFFSKPYIALVDGIVMGGGMGISAHGRYRVITDKTRFAMPETGIGFFPDVGGGHFLNHCPGKVGLYLGLSGDIIDADDCMYVGYGTHFVPSDKLDQVFRALIHDGGQCVKTVLEGICSHEAVGASSLAQHRDSIDRHFSFETMEDIFDSLSCDDGGWAQNTLAHLETRSPTSLAITLEQYLRAGRMSFKDAMIMEYRLSQAFMKCPDFYEGIRAVLIDRDKTPKWHPDHVSQVGEEDVENFFTSLGQNDLRL